MTKSRPQSHVRLSALLFFRLLVCLFTSPLVFSASHVAAQDNASFKLHFSKAAFSEPFTGDVLLAFSEQQEPLESMHQWFNAPPVARFTVTEVAPGGFVTLKLKDATARYPQDWSNLAEKYRVQAVARVNAISRMAGRGEGDVFSKPAVVQLGQKFVHTIELDLDQVVSAEGFEETERIRLFEIESTSLTKFHGFSYMIRAGVMLPQNYDPKATYPVVYDIPGFGGTHRGIHRKLSRLAKESYLQNCIVVVPDPSNRYGHSVFCNSRSIGPWGDALTRDLIPQLEKKFGGAGPSHRYVTGVSSGGWSCLYLQITYPQEFAGCWSHVPDPIDFHDFQQINLYEPESKSKPRNMYTDEYGRKRPLARRGDEVLLTYEEFARREHVTNPGGQIRSFEATFSFPSDDGTPQRVFDVDRGTVDHEVAQTWRPYDLANTMLTQWSELRDDLKDKIHIYAGEKDTFYLNGAVERFKELAELAGIHKDMEIKVVPGMAHSQYPNGYREMLQTIEANFEVPVVQ